jgi:hypothetical protein
MFYFRPNHPFDVGLIQQFCQSFVFLQSQGLGVPGEESFHVVLFRLFGCLEVASDRRIRPGREVFVSMGKDGQNQKKEDGKRKNFFHHPP